MRKHSFQLKKARIWLLVIAILASILIGIPGTLATFLTRGGAENYISFGGVDLKIVQTTLNSEGGEEQYSLSQAQNIASQAKQSRIIRVKNTGSHPLYVRVQPQFNGKDSDEKPFDVAKFVEFEINQEDWVHRDGWYYYKRVLQPDEVSEILLDELIFDVNHITESFPGSTFDVNFYAQGVQSEHQEAADVLGVVGWPKE